MLAKVRVDDDQIAVPARRYPSDAEFSRGTPPEAVGANLLSLEVVVLYAILQRWERKREINVLGNLVDTAFVHPRAGHTNVSSHVRSYAGRGRASPKPAGAGKAGEPSAFQPYDCVRIVRPSQPEFGSAFAWYTTYGTPLRSYGNEAWPGPYALEEDDMTGRSSRTHQLERTTEVTPMISGSMRHEGNNKTYEDRPRYRYP